MDQKKMLTLALVGLGAYLLMSSRANAASVPQYRVPGTTATGAPAYLTAPTVVAATEAAAYRDIGSLIGSIYRKIGGGGSSIAPIRSGPVVLPDDSLAVNPFGGDPYSYEAQMWGVDPSDLTFATPWQ